MGVRLHHPGLDLDLQDQQLNLLAPPGVALAVAPKGVRAATPPVVLPAALLLAHPRTDQGLALLGPTPQTQSDLPILVAVKKVVLE